MVTEDDIRDAGFVPYEYVKVSNTINRETLRHDRQYVTRLEVFVLLSTPKNSTKTVPSDPYILMEVHHQLEQGNGKMVSVSLPARYEGRHGALGFPLNTIEQLFKFKSYVNQNSDRKSVQETSL